VGALAASVLAGSLAACGLLEPHRPAGVALAPTAARIEVATGIPLTRLQPAVTEGTVAVIDATYSGGTADQNVVVVGFRSPARIRALTGSDRPPLPARTALVRYRNVAVIYTRGPAATDLTATIRKAVFAGGA
jgi:hypothetical protein